MTFLFATATWAQGTGTGFPMYGSFEGGVSDTTNRYNLNTNFSIPIVTSKGRGLDLNFALSYNSWLWMISSGAWVSVPSAAGTGTWGWMKTYPAGMLTNTTSVAGSCKIDGVQLVTYYRYSNYVYYDMAGTGHSFPTISWYTNACTDVTYGTTAGSAVDGSGYYYDSQSSLLFDKSGVQISPGSKIKDTNGNYISATVVNSSETDWKDSAGHNALKIVTGASSIQYKVLDPNGNYQTTTVNLTTYNIKTNFGCSGVTEYTGTASLPSSISLPNGLSYSFLYEGTPSHSGYYTGRVSKVTLPNGGYIQYQYNSPNDGINCTDGSILNLTRTVSDGSATNSWTFSRAQNGSNWVTTVTAPQMPYDTATNQSVYTFNSSGQETTRQLYQGSSSSGTLLRTMNTTWASNGSPATKTTILEDNHETEVETTFDSNGNLQVLKEHDYGSGAPGAVLRTTSYTYLSTSAYTNLNILNRVTEKTIADPTGTTQYREDTAFDGTTLSSCPAGAAQHDDTSYGCSFTTRGNPSSVTTYTNAAAPSGGVTKNSYYDGFGNLVQADINCCQSKTWTFSSTTQYAYPDSETCGSTGGPQLTTSHTYNSYIGQVLTETDSNNQTTHYSYDFIRRLISVTRPDNAQTTYTYTDSQKKYAVSKPVQGTAVNATTIFLDGLGRAVTASITDASNNTYSQVQRSYDALGRIYQNSIPFLSSPQYWGTNQYDALGRITKRILPDTQQTMNSYSGPTITSTDPSGKQSKVQFDGAGRMMSTFEPDVTNNNSLTVQTSYSYTVLGSVGTVTQGSQTRSFSFDGMGRLTSETMPEAGTIGYQYNTFDLMTQRTDARGVITNYSYDAINRNTQVSYNVGTTGVAATASVTYTFGTSATQNNNGRVTTMTDGLGSESYTYDILGRVTQLQKVVNGTTYPINYGFNLVGSVTSLTYPSGRIVTPNYDNIGRLSSLSSGSTNLVSNLTYDALFGPTGFTYGNGVSAVTGYSANRGQLTSMTYSKSSQTLFGLTYSYAQSGGNNGQIASITDSVDSGRNANYAYDALGRLSTASTAGSTNYPAWGLSFGYDRYGNRTSQSVTAGTGPSNQVDVSATTNHITTLGYAYDANGNMTNDGMNTLTYDAENRALSSAGILGSATYSYDGNDLRLLKTTSGTTTIYIFDGSSVLAEYASGASLSSPTREYAYMGGRLLSKFESGATNYYHGDRLSPRLITDSSGNVAIQQGHFPFGESWYVSGPTTKWQFTSYERDGESGNDYAKFRYGVNRVGRFSTGDPVRELRTSAPQTHNRYSYVANDPINRKDPLGRRAEYCSTPRSDDSIYNNDPLNILGGFEDPNADLGDLQWLFCVDHFNPESPEPKKNPCSNFGDSPFNVAFGPDVSVDCKKGATGTTRLDLGGQPFSSNQLRITNVTATSSDPRHLRVKVHPNLFQSNSWLADYTVMRGGDGGTISWHIKYQCKDFMTDTWGSTLTYPGPGDTPPDVSITCK